MMKFLEGFRRAFSEQPLDSSTLACLVGPLLTNGRVKRG